MNLRRRLSALVVLGCLVTAGAVAGLGAVGTGSPRSATTALLAGVVVLALITVWVSWRALRLSALPLERVADRAGRRESPMRPGLLTGPMDPEVRVLAHALEEAAAALGTRQEELDRMRMSFRNALTRLGDVLESTHDREGILDAMVEVALLVVPGDVAVYYRPLGVSALEATHGRGMGVTGLQLAHGGLAGLAAARGELTVLGSGPPGAIVVDAAELDPREPKGVAGVAAPMRMSGRLVGVLAVYGTSVGRPFDDGEVGLLVSLLRQAEVAINNVDLHDRARREALTDGVTGLWNRRQFDIRLREAIASSQRFGEPFGLAMFDLDNFKRVNDTWDHLTGDAALVHFAAVLRGATRDVDSVSRWGGEEFALLLPRTSIDDTVVVTQRVIDRLRESPLLKGEVRIPLTVSAGVAAYPDDGATAHDVLAAADSALLQAKAEGKDRLFRASCGHPTASHPQEPAR
jgi:diguanylate cyclase (GGDEF)-like protein